MFPPSLLYTAFLIFFLVCFFCVFLLITCVPLQIFSGQLLPLFLSSPVCGCLLAARGRCGSTTGNYTSGEGNTRARQPREHTHTRTHINKQWLRASLTGRLIVSQELIVKLEKLECHESCAWTCTSSCLCARAQSPAARKFLQISVKSIKCLWIWNYHCLWGIAGTGLSKCVCIFVLHDKALRFGNTAVVWWSSDRSKIKILPWNIFFCNIILADVL